ncbi:hypothetical protein DRP77_06195, partial [Candidatus Poribacteria bacterium]
MRAWFLILPLAIALSAPYSTLSKRWDGLMALYMLLEELGYEVRRVTGSPFRLPKGMRAFFLVQPSEELKEGEIDELVEWAGRGNVLIAAGDLPLAPLAERLGLRLVEGSGIFESGAIGVQLRKPRVERAIVKTTWRLRPWDSRSDVIPLCGDAEGATVVMVRLGRGVVFLISSPFPLTNAGLKYEENVDLLSNLLSFLPRGSEVGFDEYHHGLRTIRLPMGELISIGGFLASPLG